MSRHKVLDAGAFYFAIGNGHIKGFAVAIELARQGLGCGATEGFRSRQS